MRSIKHCLYLVVLTSGIAVAQVSEHQRDGSLEAENPLSCIPVADVKPTHSAADVAMGAADCLSKGQHGRAAKLIMIASAYAHFDTQRVADESAHAALQAIFAEPFSDQPRGAVEQMYEAVQALSPESDAHQAVCDSLSSSGPPSYYPRYMINHGMAAFVDDDSKPLLREFDPDGAWENSLHDFVNCTQN